MKINKLFAALLSFAMAFSFMACEGEIGPAGPAGVNGVDGMDGMDANSNCVECHGSNQLITAKLFQYDNSVHFLGGHSSYGSRTNCAICHSSQGFVEVAGTGAQETAGPIDDPLPINCYTCHQIHSTYTADDWALTANNPVTFWVGGETRDIGAGNLCINCHQARERSPGVPEVGSTELLTITSSHWGSHYSAQGGIFTGATAYEVPGSKAYTNSFHTDNVENGCVGCHMAPVTGGRDAGGHTFRVSDIDGEINYNACAACHDDEDDLIMLVENTQMGIEDLLFALGEELFAQGIFDADHGIVTPATDLTANQAGAVWNYILVEDDHSLGVHNAKYARALLTNSLESIQ